METINKAKAAALLVFLLIVGGITRCVSDAGAFERLQAFDKAALSVAYGVVCKLDTSEYTSIQVAEALRLLGKTYEQVQDDLERLAVVHIARLQESDSIEERCGEITRIVTQAAN